MYQQKYGKVAVVAQTGGDYTDPVTAMNDVATWCGTPSASNPCLLKIMPGIYDVGAMSLLMQSFVDIEGSGENVTKILGNGNQPQGHLYSLILGASNAELRNISIEVRQNGGRYAFAITNNVTSPQLTNVTILASGGTGWTVGLQNIGCSAIAKNVTISVTGSGGYAYGVWNNTNSSASNPPVLNNVVISTNGSGVKNWYSYATLINVFANGWIGLDNDMYSIAKVDHSVFSGDSSSNDVLNQNAGSLYLGYTKTEHGHIGNSGTLIKCIGTYDGNYDAITCP